MHVELSRESRAKLEDILEQLQTYYDMEELTPEELLDALLDLGVDLLLPEELPVTNPRDQLIAYCGQKISARG